MGLLKGILFENGLKPRQSSLDLVEASLYRGRRLIVMVD